MDPTTDHETGAPAPDAAPAAIFRAPIEPTAAREGLFEVLFADEVDEWPARTTRRGPHLGWPALGLAALVLVVGGMGLGSYLQRTRTNSTSSLFSRLAGARSGAFSGLAGLGTGAGTGATTGTLTDVIGHTLYVTTASGALVKVSVGTSSTVTRTTASGLGSLRVGDSVVVRGVTQHGTVRATSVTASAKGVSALGALVP